MVSQYCESIASANVALQLSEQMFEASVGASPVDSVLNQEETWQMSQNKFCRDLQSNGAQYPDIVEPILASAYEVKIISSSSSKNC